MKEQKSIGSIKSYTPGFKFFIPRFDIATWHDYIEANFRSIDALFYNLFDIQNFSGEWTQLKEYKKGQVLFIGEDIVKNELGNKHSEYEGRLVKVLEDHTTDNSEYFNIFLDKFPNYYEFFLDASTAQQDAMKAHEAMLQAQQAEQNAKVSEQNAKSSEDKALISENNAKSSENSALDSKNSAEIAANTAVTVVDGFDQHALEAQNDFDVNALTLTARFDNNYKDKTELFDNNALTLTEGYNTNALQKLDEYNDNVTLKEKQYNDNALNKLNSYNANDLAKTNAYNSNDKKKTDTFNTNYTEKLNIFNTNASNKQNLVDTSAEKAAQSELNAKQSENNALASKNAAGISEDNARESERLARLSKEAAATSEDNAAMSASDALLSEQNAKKSETNSKTSEDNSKLSETNAKSSETSANLSAKNAKTSETNSKNSEISSANNKEESRKWAVGSIEERPEGSAEYWAKQAAKGQLQADWNQMDSVAKDFIKNKPNVLTTDTDEEVNSSKTFLKDQSIKTNSLNINTDRNKRGNGLIFTDKNGTQSAGIGPYVNNNGAVECRFVASNGNKSAFGGLGITKDGQGFFEVPTPSADSNNRDAINSEWINPKLKSLQDDINGKQPAGSYQTIGNLSQTLDASASKYPSNKAVATAIANIDALPTQTGQAGKFLSTDGTSAKWDTVDLSSKANTSLDNLSEAGEKHFLGNRNISNCITEIPQDIKLELKDGVLIVKAGSKVYIPNGTNIFDTLITTKDVSTTTLNINGEWFLFIDRNQNYQWELISNCFSGENLPTQSGQNRIGFNTKTGKMQRSEKGGKYFNMDTSLPVCKFITSGGKITSIDQVFNGFGYIGSTVFALPNVKGLIPDGRNADGSLKSVEFSISQVVTYSPSSTLNLPVRWTIGNNYIGLVGFSFSEYDEQANINTDLGKKINYTFCGTGQVVNGRITSFNPKQPFQALDYNNKPEITSLGFPSDKFIDLSLGASGQPYVAPANGCFVLDIKATNNGAVWGGNVGGGWFDGRSKSSGNIQWTTPMCLKGSSTKIWFSGTGSVSGFRFVFAEGDK